MTSSTTPLTYNLYVAEVAQLAVVGSFTPAVTTTVNGVNYTAGITYGGSLAAPDVNFNALIPQMLNYAELRIQRDLDLLNLLTSNSTYSLIAGSNVLSLSVNDFVTIQNISIKTGTTALPMLPVAKEFLQNVYNDTSYTGVPTYFAMYGGDASTGGNTSINVIVGPYPNQSYGVLINGTIRQQSLNAFANAGQATSATTFMSTFLPDMLIQASMIYVSQFQRNFGPASNDPQMGPTYEAVYQSLLKGAVGEEFRKRFEASAWTSLPSSPVATPTR